MPPWHSGEPSSGLDTTNVKGANKQDYVTQAQSNTKVRTELEICRVGKEQREGESSTIQLSTVVDSAVTHASKHSTP